MAILLTGLLIVVLVIGTLWILHRQRTNLHIPQQSHRASRNPSVKSATRSSPHGKTGDDWVMVIESPGCEAAKALAGRIFTHEEAPQLPIEGCNATTCTCHYRYIPEQRNDHRRSLRRAACRRFLAVPRKTERRSRKDRRRGNWDDRAF